MTRSHLLGRSGRAWRGKGAPATCAQTRERTAFGLAAGTARLSAPWALASQSATAVEAARLSALSGPAAAVQAARLSAQSAPGTHNGFSATQNGVSTSERQPAGRHPAVCDLRTPAQHSSELKVSPKSAQEVMILDSG